MSQFEKKRPARFPFEVEDRHGKATIYRRRRNKSGKKYWEYRLAWYGGDRSRQLEYFASFTEAVSAAKGYLAALVAGTTITRTLTGVSLADYESALRLLPPGAKLAEVVNEWARAKEILDELPLLEAVRDYRRRHADGMPMIRVSDAVEQFISDKVSARCSERYLDDLHSRLKRFANDFQCNLTSLTKETLRTWFGHLKVAPKTFNNIRGNLDTFFRWCIRRGWLPREWHELEAIEKRRSQPSSITTYTAGELQKLLNAAPLDILPSLAIAAFTGARSEEIRRLEWRDVRLDEGFVELAAAKTKTRSRRLVPTCPTLRAWLKPHLQESGLVWRHSTPYFYELVRKLSTLAKVPWRPNAMRHSWISARTAQTKDVNATALEAGNSPAIIFAHYRQLMTDVQATAWFSVMPQRVPDSSAEALVEAGSLP